jgi:hypothetical protein
MHDVMLGSGRDSILFGAFLILILFAVHFRLDELVFRSKKKPARQRPPTATVRKSKCYDQYSEQYSDDNSQSTAVGIDASQPK